MLIKAKMLSLKDKANAKFGAEQKKVGGLAEEKPKIEAKPKTKKRK